MARVPRSVSDQVAFVSEGPSEPEAEQLLAKMIAAMGLSREQVQIIEATGPQLERQLETLRPRLIVALGEPTAQALLNTQENIAALRGRFHTYGGGRLMVTFHPAHLLKYPESKREAWTDLKQVQAEFGK